MRRREPLSSLRVRSCYILGISLVITSYICSLITTTRFLHRCQNLEVKQPLEVDEEWPPTAFFRNIQGVGNNSRFVVTIVNYDYVDFADNFAQSLLRQNQSNFCLVPIDEQAYDLLHLIYPKHVLPVPSGVSKKYRHVQNFGSRAFRDLAALRPVILQRLLFATNLTLLYNDIDMVWRKNMWDAVDSYRSPLQEPIILWTDGSQQLCSCLLYLDPTTESHLLLDKWKEELDKGTHKNDQPALNVAVKVLGSNQITPPWKIIRDYERFPHGAYYFGPMKSPVPPGIPQYEKRRSKAVIVHNNWAHNKTVKTIRFQQYGLWNISQAMQMHISMVEGKVNGLKKLIL